MRKLGARLHCSATILYGYFQNKDDLLLAVVGEGYEVFRTHISKARGGDGVEHFLAIGKAYTDFAFENPELYTLMFIRRPGSLFDQGELVIQSRMQILFDTMEAARRTPALASADDESVRRVVELWWALVHGLISIALEIGVTRRAKASHIPDGAGFPVFGEEWARANLAFLVERLRPVLAGASWASLRS